MQVDQNQSVHEHKVTHDPKTNVFTLFRNGVVALCPFQAPTLVPVVKKVAVGGEPTMDYQIQRQVCTTQCPLARVDLTGGEEGQEDAKLHYCMHCSAAGPLKYEVSIHQPQVEQKPSSILKSI